MDKKQRSEVLKMTEDFKTVCEEYAGKLLTKIKENCSTYGEVDKELEILWETSRAWQSRDDMRLIVNIAKKLIEQEKGRLLVADGPSLNGSILPD